MEGLSPDLLVRILSSTEDYLDGQPTPRLVCTSWRQAFDATLRVLRPSRWPNQDQRGLVPAILRKLEHLDLTGLELADAVPAVADASAASYESISTASSSHQDLSGTQLSSSSMQLDLTGAAVLQPRLQLPVQAADAGTPADTMIAAPLMCYVTAMWPEAAPHVTPAASLRMWGCLAQLQCLQELRLSGAMLLITGVRTAVDGCPDAASGLRLLQQHTAADSDSLVSTAPCITYTYTLQLPPALHTMTALRSLAINWELKEPQACGEGLWGTRRRSYEGGCCAPSTQHVADPTISLPKQFSALVNLQHLELSGCILHPSTLLPLQGLIQLQHLALGPGRINSHALVPLAAAGVLGGLTQLVLKQQASWDVDSVAAVLAALTRVEVLEVHELEMSSADLAATEPQLQVLTAAHMAVPGHTLQRLAWVTCGQRLTAGASLLCPSASAAALGQPAQHPGDASSAAAGPWLGALTALQALELAGILRERSALGAPVVDALSSSIGGCSRLEDLTIRGLGLPALPEALAMLPLLRCVTMEACAVPRRSVVGPEAALGVLGRCRGLQKLTLAGCELRHVPGWLGGLTGVTSLQLQHNYIQDLPYGAPCCGLPAGVQCLNLTDNRLREVPDCIVLLSSLRVCVLDGNYLTSLPGSIWDLPALEELSVQENMLGSLPECSRQVAVHSCCEDVRGQIPKRVTDGSSSSSRSPWGPGSTAGVAVAAVGFAAADRVAGPSTHQDTHAGSGFEGLTAEEEDLLSAVGVGRRSSSSSSSSVLVPSLASASAAAPFAAGVAVVAVRQGSRQQPCVQHGHGVPLHEPAACADSLRSLVLSGNQLSEVPASISQLVNLCRLDLSKNQLRSLPDSAGLWGCTRLTQLQLADNHLRQLPAGLSQLQCLVQVDVSGNHLTMHIQRDPPPAVPAAVSATTAVAECSNLGRYRDASGKPSSCSVTQGSRTAAGKPGPAAHCPGTVTVLLEVPAAAPHMLAANISRSTAVRRPAGSLPCPLRNLPALQQLRLGRQQLEESSRCPLQLLLGGLGVLAERVKCLAPHTHQCPVAKAAAAAVAHLTGVTGARRARALQQQLAETHIRDELQGVAVPGASRKGVCLHV